MVILKYLHYRDFASVATWRFGDHLPTSVLYHPVINTLSVSVGNNLKKS